MDLREVDCNTGEWIDVAQDRYQWWAYISELVSEC